MCTLGFNTYHITGWSTRHVKDHHTHLVRMLFVVFFKVVGNIFLEKGYLSWWGIVLFHIEVHYKYTDILIFLYLGVDKHLIMSWLLQDLVRIDHLKESIYWHSSFEESILCMDIALQHLDPFETIISIWNLNNFFDKIRNLSNFYLNVEPLILDYEFLHWLWKQWQYVSVSVSIIGHKCHISAVGGIALHRLKQWWLTQQVVLSSTSEAGKRLSLHHFLCGLFHSRTILVLCQLKLFFLLWPLLVLVR